MLFLASCDSDVEKVKILGFEEAELKSTASEVVLSSATAEKLVFSLMWNAGELTTTGSDDYGVTPNTLVTTLQFSTQSTFEDMTEVAEKSSAKSYTGKALNALALGLGVKPDETQTIYVRLKSALGANIEPLFSNVIEVKVTPYEEVAFLYMPGDLSGGWDSYTTKLCSPEGNGIYQGFIDAGAWANFKFATEPNNTTATVYGSAPDQLYALDNSSSQWNIWFDEGGYFLVEANLKTMSWKKTAVTGFSVTGEFNGWSLATDKMTYDSAQKVWTVTCDITNTQYGIQIIMNDNWDLKYGSKAAGELVAGGTNITIDKVGTYTITLDLSNPQKYTYSIQ